MFSLKHKSKIKKILRWKLELTAYTYDISYRSGSLNQVADALTRYECNATSLFSANPLPGSKRDSETFPDTPI